MYKIHLRVIYLNISSSPEYIILNLEKFYKTYLLSRFEGESIFVEFQGANKFVEHNQFIGEKKYKIYKINSETYTTYKDSIIEIELPVIEFKEMIKLPYKSEYMQENKSVFGITFGNLPIDDMYKVQSGSFKKNNRNNFFQININQHAKQTFNISLELILNKADIDKNLAKQWLLHFVECYNSKLFTYGIQRFYPEWTSAESVFLNRLAIDWFTFIPAEILPEEVPSAHEIVYVPNWGSIIISTEEPYDFQNPEMRKIGAAIEKELYDLGLLPITASGHSPAIWELPFISREQRLKNRVK